MAGSFLLDWEEMSKAFRAENSELFKKEATRGTLEARPSPMEYVGWSPREKVGWAFVHSQGVGRSYRDGVSIRVGRQLLGCVLFPCWTTSQKMKQ